MIHPGLNDSRPLVPQDASQSGDRPGVEDARPHPDHPDGDPSRQDGVGQPQVVDQRDDHWLESRAIGASQKVAEHHLRPAELEAINNMNDFRFHV
jgi:hypothetical protein